MNTRRAPLAFVVLVSTACGAVLLPDPPREPEDCTFDQLRFPATACEQLEGDSMFTGICATDCTGAVYPKENHSDMQNFPSGRFYAVFFRPLGSVDIEPNQVSAFAAKRNIIVPIGSPIPEDDPRNRISFDVVRDSGTRGLLVRIKERLDGPIQLAIVVGGYHWRAYVGGAPIGPYVSPDPPG